MSAYFDQLLSSATAAPAPAPAPESWTPDAGSDLSEVTEERDAPPAPNPAPQVPERTAGARPVPNSVSQTPALRSGPASSVSAPRSEAAPGVRPAPAEVPRESPEVRPSVEHASTPASAGMTIREIIEWVAAPAAESKTAEAPSSSVSDVKPVSSGPDLIEASPHSARPAAPQRALDPKPSLKIETERVVTVEPATPPAPAEPRSVATVHVAPQVRERQPEPALREADEISVSIGAIQVVVEGPREPARPPIAPLPTATLSSRLARRYLRPL